MDELNKSKPAKPFSPDFLTDQERQDRIVEILTRGVLRLIEKKKQNCQSRTASPGGSGDFIDDKTRNILKESP